MNKAIFLQINKTTFEKSENLEEEKKNSQKSEPG